MVASLAVHVTLLLALLYASRPLFLTPHDVALGIPGSSGSVSIIYLAPVGAEQTRSVPDKPHLTLRAALAKKPKPQPKVEPKPEPEQPTVDAGLERAARGGSPMGRVPGSPLTGDEVIPALPEVFPDPPVSRSDLPAGRAGRRDRRSHHRPAGECRGNQAASRHRLRGRAEGSGRVAALAFPSGHARRCDHRLATHRALPLPQLARISASGAGHRGRCPRSLRNQAHRIDVT